MARTAPDEIRTAPGVSASSRPPRRSRHFNALLLLASVGAALALVVIPHAGLPLALSAAVPAAAAASGSAAEACAPGNRVAFAHSLVIGPGEWICGDADAYGGGMRIQGRVAGNVMAVGGNVAISGEVDGNVTVFGGNVYLLPHARVAGDVQTWGGVTHADPSAAVAGSLERSDRLANTRDVLLPSAGHTGLPWPWVLGWSLLAAVVITLFPERTSRVRAVAGSAAVRSAAVGLLTLVLGLGLAGLLFFTCIGIPVSLFVLVVMLAGWVLGTVAVGLWLGERILHALAPGERATMLPAVMGVAILSGVELLPCVGAAIAVVTSCLGLGAALLSRFGSPRHSFPIALPASFPPQM